MNSVNRALIRAEIPFNKSSFYHTVTIDAELECSQMDVFTGPFIQS